MDFIDCLLETSFKNPALKQLIKTPLFVIFLPTLASRTVFFTYFLIIGKINFRLRLEKSSVITRRKERLLYIRSNIIQCFGTSPFPGKVHRATGQRSGASISTQWCASFQQAEEQNWGLAAIILQTKFIHILELPVMMPNQNSHLLQLLYLRAVWSTKVFLYPSEFFCFALIIGQIMHVPLIQSRLKKRKMAGLQVKIDKLDFRATAGGRQDIFCKLRVLFVLQWCLEMPI